jgi:hypothetical protein
VGALFASVKDMGMDDERVLAHDSSTNALIRRYRRIKAGTG